MAFWRYNPEIDNKAILVWPDDARPHELLYVTDVMLTMRETRARGFRDDRHELFMGKVFWALRDCGWFLFSPRSVAQRFADASRELEYIGGDWGEYWRKRLAGVEESKRASELRLLRYDVLTLIGQLQELVNAIEGKDSFGQEK